MSEVSTLRKHFGEYLEKLGGKNKNLVVLDCDLSNNLNTLLFAKSFPERHFSLPQTERTGLAMATGMCVRKKSPWVCASGGALLGQALDVLKNGVSAPNLNIKIILSDVGLGNIEEGLTKTTTEDLAVLQSLPNIKIFTPADQYELRAIMDFMVNDYGPTVLRLGRKCQDDLYDSNYLFKEGQPVITKQGAQVCLFSSGNMLRQTLTASTELLSKGLSTQVINISSLQPLDESAIAELCRNYELILSVEDHNLHGGLGTRIAEIMQKNNICTRLIKLALSSGVESGKYQEVLDKHGLGSRSIYETVRENWLKT